MGFLLDAVIDMVHGYPSVTEELFSPTFCADRLLPSDLASDKNGVNVNNRSMSGIKCSYKHLHVPRKSAGLKYRSQVTGQVTLRLALTLKLP